MSSHHLCHHHPCYNRVQPNVPPTQRHHYLQPCLLVSCRFSRCCRKAAAQRAAIHCSSNPDGQQSESDRSPADGVMPSSLPSNRALLAVGSIGLAVVAFVASRSLLGRPALDELKLQSMPLDSALNNGRPTVLEFYADWCEVCSELAPTALQVRPVSSLLLLWHTCMHPWPSTEGDHSCWICCQFAWRDMSRNFIFYLYCTDQADLQGQCQFCHAEH